MVKYVVDNTPIKQSPANYCSDRNVSLADVIKSANLNHQTPYTYCKKEAARFRMLVAGYIALQAEQ